MRANSQSYIPFIVCYYHPGPPLEVHDTHTSPPTEAYIIQISNSFLTYGWRKSGSILNGIMTGGSARPEEDEWMHGGGNRREGTNFRI